MSLKSIVLQNATGIFLTILHIHHQKTQMLYCGIQLERRYHLHQASVYPLLLLHRMKHKQKDICIGQTTGPNIKWMIIY